MSDNLLLPELNQSDLDLGTIEQLFNDIAELCQVIAVIPKSRETAYCSSETTLEQGKSLLLEGEITGLQIRYLYNNKQWWDILINRGNHIRLTRIKHDFTTEP